MVVDLDDVDTKMKSSTWRQRETGKSGILRGRLSTSYKNQADREKSSKVEAEYQIFNFDDVNWI